ncbi:hypothetical protein OPV22_019426 [Ensete ventricosum]|uniref:Uncharacterized protein n=1 Tax=Ensete ventricosum TaxID=4639 RepID=A0AAV8Q7K9_ENSVE|nr:hypothetical protein OPV22_019426 [Ensete ventricosum]
MDIVISDCYHLIRSSYDIKDRSSDSHNHSEIKCEHCKKLAPEYEKLGSSFKKAKSVLIGKVWSRQFYPGWKSKSKNQEVIYSARYGKIYLKAAKSFVKKGADYAKKEIDWLQLMLEKLKPMQASPTPTFFKIQDFVIRFCFPVTIHTLVEDDDESSQASAPGSLNLTYPQVTMKLD